MEWIQIIQAILSLVFVLGLLFMTIWFFKYCEQKGLRTRFFNQLKSGSRINIVETRRIDARSSLVLVTCDNTQHLILNSNNTSLLIESKPIPKGPSAHE